jgi:TolA-binding protein
LRRVSQRLPAAAALLLAPFAFAQSSPEQQAKSLLDDGRGYYAKGQYKQALDNFNTIVSGFPNTESVDDALLEIGRYQAEVEGDVDKARASFESVSKRFPQSDSAPGAYHQLGLLTLDKARSPAELDDALAQFTRVQRLYPKSEWVPRSLSASGLVLRKAGRLPEAVETQRRVTLEYPTSDAAIQAQYEVGHCLALLGEPRPAMEAFQQLRNAHPQGEWAARALERITGLYRLSEGTRPFFSSDAGWSIGAGDVLKDVDAILMTPARTLWIASNKARAAVAFDKDAKMGASLGAEDLRGLSLTPKGELVVASRLGVRFGRDAKSFSVPTSKPGEQEPLERISAALVLPGGDVLVADQKRKRVHRFGPRFDYKGPFPDAKEREITRLALDGEGGIAMLDADEKSVRVYDDSGRQLRAIPAKGPGYELKKPADIAIDPARNLFLADEEAGVLLFAPDGRLLAGLPPEEVKKPRALTLEPGGALLVYDDKAQKVLRFK